MSIKKDNLPSYEPSYQTIGILSDLDKTMKLLQIIQDTTFAAHDREKIVKKLNEVELKILGTEA